jgi:hypothetical protein
MASAIVQEIQQELRRFLDGSIELHEFEDFFVPRLRDLESSSDEAAAGFAGHVHILLSEYSRGDRLLASLKEELGRITRHPVEVETR